MKHLLMALMISSILTVNCFGKQLLESSANQSIGGSIGGIWALTYQMPYRDNNVLAFSTGVSAHNFLVMGDMLWYQPELAKLRGVTPYIGTGAGLSTDNNLLGSNLAVFVRAPIGGTYHLKEQSMDLFAHIAPHISSQGATYLNLQIGLHYIF